MSPKQWLALLCFYISYLFFGASVFHHIEHTKELRDRANQLQERIAVNELLVKYASPEDEQVQNKVLKTVSDYCGRPVTNYTLDEYPVDYEWTFYHSFWFSFIVCSTVGYGNSSPHDQPGQAFLILYALIGLPVNGFVLAYLGDFFSKTFIGIYNRYKGYKNAPDQHLVAVKKFGMIGRIMMFLIPGITFFIFLPACLFAYFEDWPYIRSVYYSFITLTTIGYGDFVPTFQDGQARKFGIYFTIYQIFIVFWSFIGVGYFIMIIGFIAKGMQSKRIARLEHQLSTNIKATQHRIWTGVTKDLSFLRRILNEVNMLKFKPVYTDSLEKRASYSLPRSLSCPELTMYRTGSRRILRKRAYSENYNEMIDSSSLILNRVQSDGDLSRIDKEKTFEGSGTLFQTGDLLSKVLSALGSMTNLPTSEDLQSSSDSISYTIPPVRQRAFSECYFPEQDSPKSSYEWTWNGNNAHQIKDYLKNKTKKFSIPSAESSNRSQTLNIRNTLEVPTESLYRSFMSKINPFKVRVLGQESKRNSVTSQDFNTQKYLENTSKGRESKISLSRQYLSQTSTNNMELLEKTTIGDLIRAVADIEAKVNMSPESPRIKMGTISPSMQSLLIPTNQSRRGSLRPVPGYTTVFTSQNINNPRNNLKNSQVDRSSLHPQSTVATKPIQRRIRSTSTSISHVDTPPALISSVPPNILQRTLSLCPSPLATSPQTSQYARSISQIPIITVQPPNATTRNLWRPESRAKDGSVSASKDPTRINRADSK